MKRLSEIIKGIGLLVAIIASLIVLASVGTMGCQLVQSGSSIVSKADEEVSAQIKWLDEQKFREPEPPPPLDISLDSVESSTHRIGRSAAGVGVGFQIEGFGGGIGGFGDGGGGDGGGGGGGGGG